MVRYAISSYKQSSLRLVSWEMARTFTKREPTGNIPQEENQQEDEQEILRMHLNGIGIYGKCGRIAQRDKAKMLLQQTNNKPEQYAQSTSNSC